MTSRACSEAGRSLGGPPNGGVVTGRLGCGDASDRRRPSARRRPADEAPRQADRAGRVPIPHAAIGRDPGRGSDPIARRDAFRSGDPARAVHRLGARRRPGGHPRPSRRPRLAGRRHRPLPGHHGRLPGDGARRGDARAAGLLREAPAARRAARAVARPDARHRWVRLRRGHVRASGAAARPHVRVRGGRAGRGRAHGGRPPRRADRRRGAGPAAERARVHRARPRGLRGPSLRHG